MDKKGAYPRVYYEMLVIGFSIVLGMGLISSFLPILARDLDPSGKLVGYVVSAWFLARVFIELPSGFVSDRIGRRRLFIIGVALAAAGSLLCAITGSIYQLIAGRALWGFGIALFFLNNTAILFDLFPPEARGRSIGTFQGLQFIGSLLGAPVGGFIAGLFGYYNVFFVSVALTSISLLLSSTSKGLKGIGGAPSDSLPHPSLIDALTSLRSLNIITVCVLCFFRMFIINGVMSTVFQLYLHEHLGFGLGLIGVILGVRTTGFTLTTLASGYLSDRIGRRIVILAGFLVEALCFYAITLLRPFELILLIGFMDGLGAGLGWAPLTVLLSDIVKPEFRGISLGLYRTFLDVGGIVGPIIFMAIALDVSIEAPFILGALIFLSMAGITITIRPRYKG